MQKWMGSLSNRINGWGGTLSGVFIIVIGLIVSYEVIMRYFFRAPTTWVLEISIYLCIGCVFLSGGYALKDKMHIQVDVLTRRFSPFNQILLQLLCLLMTLIYVSVLTWKGTEMAVTSLMTGELSPTVLNIPMVIPHSFVPIGGGLLILELIHQIMMEISRLKNAKKDERKYVPWVKRSLPFFAFLIMLVLGGSMFISRQLTPLGITLLLFVLIFGGMPIAFALGLLGLMGFSITFGGGPLLSQVPMVTYKILDDFIMVAVPLFIMLSTVLSIGGIGSSLFDVASKWVRHMPGGLGVATVLSCAIFAAMCGSSVATVATIGLIAIPEMLSRGYGRRLTFGTVAIGGVLGPLIPPSIFMILIGAITGDSVGKLFMAGMLPGILLALIFSLYIVLVSFRDKTLPRVDPAPWKERWGALRRSFFGILAPLIILGGIYSGIFTPTEAAGVGLAYSLFICGIVYRTLTFSKFLKIVQEGGKLTAAILFIVTGALVFGQVVTMLQIPEKICGFLASLPISQTAILFLTLIFILVLGALMDEASILLITYPILYYIFVENFKFDSIWFAVVFVFTLEVGLVAPPVGINLFVVQGIWKDAKFEEVVRGVLPFALLMVASILLIVYIKPLSTWLPRLIG